MNIARCRDYVARCKKAKKITPECEAIEFLLKLVDEKDLKYTQATSDQLTIPYCEAWLARWGDVPLNRLPFAVKALDYALGVLAYEREAWEESLQRLKIANSAHEEAIQITKAALERMRENSGWHYRMSPHARSRSLLKQEVDEDKKS